MTSAEARRGGPAAQRGRGPNPRRTRPPAGVQREHRNASEDWLQLVECAAWVLARALRALHASRRNPDGNPNSGNREGVAAASRESSPEVPVEAPVKLSKAKRRRMRRRKASEARTGPEAARDEAPKKETVVTQPPSSSQSVNSGGALRQGPSELTQFTSGSLEAHGAAAPASGVRGLTPCSVPVNGNQGVSYQLLSKRTPPERVMDVEMEAPPVPAKPLALNATAAPFVFGGPLLTFVSGQPLASQFAPRGPPTSLPTQTQGRQLEIRGPASFRPAKNGK
jgi:hypothetical protein